MSQSLDDMLNDLPSKEDLEKLPRYCKWCGTWNPEITKGEATHMAYFFCKVCSDKVQRTEFTITEDMLKSKQRLDAKRQGQNK